MQQVSILLPDHSAGSNLELSVQQAGMLPLDRSLPPLAQSWFTVTVYFIIFFIKRIVNIIVVRHSIL